MKDPHSGSNQDQPQPSTSRPGVDSPQPASFRITIDLQEADAPRLPPERAMGSPTLFNRTLAALLAAWGRVVQGFTSPGPLNTRTLASLALALYLLTRLAGLGSFPPAFTSGEAVSAALGAGLLHDRLVGGPGLILPAWLEHADGFHGTAVYLQMLFHLLFGRSIFVVRLVNVLAGFLCAWALHRILREGWQLPSAWSAPLVLSLSAAWFLLSRSGFDMALLASLYALSILYYLRYRGGSPPAIYPAVLCWALVLYTSSAGAILALGTLAALAVLDARWHWRQRAASARAGLLLLLFLVPALRQALVPGQPGFGQVLLHGSFLLQGAPFSLLLSGLARNIAGVLNPLYWVLPGRADTPLLQAPVHAGFASLLFPFTLWGLWETLRTLRLPASRLLLVLLLLCSLPAAFWGARLPHSILLILPLVLLTSLGLGRLLLVLGRARPRPAARPELLLFLALCLAAGLTAYDLLLNSPARVRDYGRGGIQYGAAQVYQLIGRHRTYHPDDEICLSNTWAEDPDVLARFFARNWKNFALCSPDPLASGYDPEFETRLYVWTSGDLEALKTSGHFIRLDTLAGIPCPDGRPCFSLVRMAYRQDIEQVLIDERAARNQPQTATITLDGETLSASHSPLDMGTLQNIFDGDEATFIRTLEANPLVIELWFPHPRTLRAVSLLVGSEPVAVSASIIRAGVPPAFFRLDLPAASTDYRTIDLPFGSPLSADRLHLELLDTQAAPSSHVHLWEVRLE